MNDMAALCEKVGADVDFVRKGMGADRRIGYPFLFPGVGYGGSLLPQGREGAGGHRRASTALELDLLRAVERTNERQKKLLVHKALKHFGGSLAGRRSACGAWPSSRRPTTCARRPPSR